MSAGLRPGRHGLDDLEHCVGKLNRMTKNSKEPQQPQQTEPRDYSFLQTMRAVAWGMLGVRKGKGHSEDFSRLNPLHLIVAGLLATLVFVLVLIGAARWFIGYFTH